MVTSVVDQDDDFATTIEPSIPDFSAQPRLVISADSHNVASGNGGFFSRAIDTISNIPKFWGTALASGAVGIINSGIAIGNLFNTSEDKFKEINLAKWITEYDADLGKYYRENADSIDTWGFVVSSIVPGLGGVRALNLAQKAIQTARTTGVLGPNMAKATGLLVPNAEVHISRAVGQIAATHERNFLIQQSALRAVASKTGQATLEAAAFETAVLASSFRSPFFSDMETSDIVSNFATGVVLGGGIGGLISAVGVRSAIKSRVDAIDRDFKLSTHVDELTAGASPDAEIVNIAKNLQVKEDFIRRVQEANPSGDITSEVLTHNLKNAQNTVTQLRNVLRTQIHKVTDDAKAVGNFFADQFLKMDPQALTANGIGLQRVKRFANHVEPPVTTGRGRQGALDLADGAGDIPDTPTIWAKLRGTDAGGTTATRPQGLTLADVVKLKGNETLKDGVDRVAKSFRNKLKEHVDVRNRGASLQSVQSRYLWAQDQSIPSGASIGAMDFPLLERALDTWDSIGSLRITSKRGKEITIESAEELQSYIFRTKDKAINDSLKNKFSVDEIAERLNVSEGYISGTAVSANKADDLLYRQKLARDEGLASQKELFYRPKYMGLEYKGDVFRAFNEHRLDAEMYLQGINKANQQTVDIAVEDALSQFSQLEIINPATGNTEYRRITESLPDAAQLHQAVQETSRSGAGARLISFANGGYGTLESAMQRIGAAVNKLDLEGRQLVQDRLTPAINLLKTDSQVAAEYGVINEIINRTGEHYVLSTRVLARDQNAAPRLINSRIRDWLEGGGDINKKPNLGEGVPETIEFKRPEVATIFEAHSQLNYNRNRGFRSLRNAEGLESYRVDDAAYGIKPDPRTARFFAFVVDDSLTGAGHTTMIHATDAATLDQMISRVQQEFPTFRIVRKDQSEAYHKALGDYEYSKTVNEDYINTSLRSKGINSQFFPVTDGNRLADNLLNWHLQKQRAYHRDIISTKYNQVFKELEWQGREYAGIQGSAYRDSFSIARGTTSNPYMEYIKVALNVSNIDAYPLLSALNRGADEIVSRAWNTGANLMQQAFRTKSPEQLDQIHEVFNHHGFKTAYYDSATELLANHQAGSGVLTRFVRRANALLATTFLRLDFINALNNGLGSAILTSTELRHVLRNIAEGNTGEVGALANLTRTAVPGTGGDSILSAKKLIARASQDYFSPQGAELVAKYEAMGLIPKDGVLAQARSVLDDLSVSGRESAADLNSKLSRAMAGAEKAFDFGENITGNRFMERFNRFMSARIMDQLTELAVAQGSMSVKEAASYINTFVNRTQVNLVGSQRPLLFQGAIGSAIGLFQSYQFNLMQQLFRYVAPGQRKTAAMLMGMQGSIYGLNGLPGFQQFNQYIIGQAAGNYTGEDLYSSIRDAAGVEAGNWLLYGAPSNLLNINLYVRGDLTPQHPTIIPGRVQDIPFISMYGRVAGAIKSTASNMSNGAGIWNSFLAGLEFNSLNRPLAGLAQVVRGLGDPEYKVKSLDQAGQLVGQNDLFSLATLGRLAGGKPFDESIARNELWRVKAYQANNNAEFANVTRALRVRLASGDDVPNDVMEGILTDYVNRGKKINRFNSWFLDQYTSVSTSQAEKLAQSTSSPYAQRMMSLMNELD